MSMTSRVPVASRNIRLPVNVSMTGFRGSRERLSGRIVWGAAARRSTKAVLPGVVTIVTPLATYVRSPPEWSKW